MTSAQEFLAAWCLLYCEVLLLWHDIRARYAYAAASRKRLHETLWELAREGRLPEPYIWR